MHQLLDDNIQEIKQLEELFIPIVENLDGLQFPVKLTNDLNKLEKSKQRFEKAIQDGDENQIISSIESFALYIHRAFSHLKSTNHVSEQYENTVDELINKSQSIRKSLSERPTVFKTNDDLIVPTSVNRSSIDYKYIADLEKKVSAISFEIERADERYRKESSDTIDRINKTDELSKKLELDVQAELEKVKNIYDKNIKEVEEKQEKLDILLGEVSGGKIALSYDASTKSEKKEADWLRFASIGFMVLIAIIVGYSFWETTLDDFKWENSAFRIILAFFLTIPSAYLARESSKHREQQYNHLQTSLDLKAIDPYISSLQKDKQDEIKADIANRIFASRDYSKVAEISFPLNSQEIAMALIKIADGNKDSDKDNKKLNKD